MPDYDIGQGIQALDFQAFVEHNRGYAVADGCEVTAGTGLSVDVAAGNAVFGQAGGSPDVVSVAGGNVSLATADANDPRKDTIYVAPDGSVNAATGTPAPYLPTGSTGVDAQQPSPPTLTGTDAVILAEVIVPANETDTTAGQIYDRRQFSETITQDAYHETVNTGEQVGVYDYRITTGSEFVDVINNQLSNGESVLIGDSFSYSTPVDVSGLSGIRIRSEGPRRFGKTLSYDGATGPAFVIDDVQQATLEDLTLEYTGETSDIDGVAATSDSGFKRSKMENIHIVGFTGDALNPRGFQSTFDHIRLQGCGRGFICDSNGQANTVTGLSSVNHTNAAIFVKSPGGGFEFFGGEASTSGTGVVIRANSNVHFHGLHHEGNDGPDYLGEVNAIGFTIQPAGLQRSSGTGPAMDFPGPRDFQINLNSAIYGGDGTVLKLGDTNAGTTAFRGTVIGNVRDAGTNTNVIDAQATTDVHHYDNTGPTAL